MTSTPSTDIHTWRRSIKRSALSLGLPLFAAIALAPSASAVPADLWDGSIATPISVSPTGPAPTFVVGAETISIVRGLSFDYHEFGYSIRNDQTFVSDVYTINAAPVVLTNDSYDALVVDLGVRSDKRIVVDDVASPVQTIVNAAWQRPNSGIAATINAYTVNYVNGSGDLPGTAGSALVNLSSDGHGIFAEDDLTQVNGGFSFQRIQIASTFGPYDGGGQYDLTAIREVTFSYRVAGNIGDPGIFTRVVVVPEPGSLALLGLGGLLLAWRRR